MFARFYLLNTPARVSLCGVVSQWSSCREDGFLGSLLFLEQMPTVKTMTHLFCCSIFLIYDSFLFFIIIFLYIVVRVSFFPQTNKLIDSARTWPPCLKLTEQSEKEKTQFWPYCREQFFIYVYHYIIVIFKYICIITYNNK